MRYHAIYTQGYPYQYNFFLLTVVNTEAEDKKHQNMHNFSSHV